MLESSLTASVRLSDEQQAELNRHKRAVRINNEKYFRCHPVRPRGQKRPPLAPPERGSCASSGRAWQAWDLRGGAWPLAAQPPPRVLGLATSRAADPAAFEREGAGSMVIP